MAEMNCERVDTLIALHVERDLHPREAAAVQRHLSQCLTCRRTAEGYRQSQAWLKGHAHTPALRGETLDKVRRTVWQRIEADAAGPRWWRWLDRYWISLRVWSGRPPVLMFAAFVLVIGTAALFRAGVVDTPSALHHEQAPTLAPARAQATVEGQKTEAPVTALMPDEEPSMFDPERLLAQAEFDEAAESDGETIEEPGTNRNRMRIELQTRDPDVRIIWFSPQDTTASLEN